MRKPAQKHQLMSYYVWPNALIITLIVFIIKDAGADSSIFFNALWQVNSILIVSLMAV